MAVFTGVIRSQTVLTELPLTLVLPQEDAPARRLLYLLHDLGQGHTSWLYRCRLEAFCRRWRAAIVLPELWRSLYSDGVFGRRLFTYLLEELPQLLEQSLSLRLSGPQDVCAAGVGLGGYGALKCMLARPDRFGRAVAVDAPLLLEEALPTLLQHGELTLGELTAHYGKPGESGKLPQPGEQERLLSLAGRLPSAQAAGLCFYHLCGDARWQQQNQRAAQALAPLLPCRYEQASRPADWEAALEQGLAFVFSEGGEGR